MSSNGAGRYNLSQNRSVCIMIMICYYCVCIGVDVLLLRLTVMLRSPPWKQVQLS